VEHIKEALGNSAKGAPIPSQTIREPESELTLEEQREQLRRSLGVASLENTFENFKPVAGTQKALAAFKALASGKAKWSMLLIYGGVGNGKTHLCEAMTIALYKRGIFCRVLSMSWIMRSLKNSMRHAAFMSYDEKLDILCYQEHLIIDDVGMGGSGSDWEFGQLEEIIVVRYRERLFTILTTNKDLTELPERVVSRFRDPDVGRVVLNEGADYRRLK